MKGDGGSGNRSGTGERRGGGEQEKKLRTGEEFWKGTKLEDNV